ncbi:MAG: transcriptional regulator [Bacillota bacterium]|nr:MAG: transcriptional regulator [Bacillota bacterium]
MATIRDIAQEAGVSVGTASRALTGNGYVSEENRAIVLKAAEKLGYVLKAATKQKKAIGIVLPDIIFPFMSAFLKYAEVELSNRGYKTFILNTLNVQDRIDFVIDLLEKKELDGIIINSEVTHAQLKKLERYPIISFERIYNNIPLIASDHIEGGKIAGETLYKSGCKNVLILTAKQGVRVYADNRIDECKKYLTEKGVRCTVAEIDSKFLTFKFVSEIVGEYFSLYSNIDGIFADDVTAYCFAAEAVRRGVQVPEKLKVLGYDGNDITLLTYPRITTIAQNIPLLAAKCVEMIPKADILFPTSLKKLS